MEIFDLQEFEADLLSTIYWYQQHFRSEDIVNSLRTPSIPLNYDGAIYGGTGDSIQPVFDLFALVKRKKFHAYKKSSQTINYGLAGGKLAILYMSSTLCDGVGPIESEGFFDACNFPAWDMWVWVGEEQHDD